MRRLSLMILAALGSSAHAQAQTYGGQPLGGSGASSTGGRGVPMAAPLPAGAASAPQLPPILRSPPPAEANWRVRPEVAVSVTATDNSAYAAVEDGRSDVIVGLAPRLRFYNRGARVNFQGDVSATALHYTRSTQSNKVLPQADLALQANVVEGWAHLDGRARVDQGASDPYGPRSEGPTSVNKLTTRSLRLSPYIERRLSADLAFLARSDHLWTRRNGEFAATDPRRDAYEEQQTVRLERDALPFGWSGEYVRQETRFSGDSTAGLRMQTARATVDYALDTQLVLGLVGGWERARFQDDEESDSLYGIRGRWQPTERTALSALVERRFFGTGWNALASHRTPFLVLQVRSFRQPVGLPNSDLLPLGAASSVAELLDAILTTRYPDPLAREPIVRELIDELGLPEVLPGPTNVYSDYPQVQTGTSLGAAFLGRRTIASVSLYERRYRQLTRSGTGPSIDPLLASDNKQRGASVEVTRRLTELTALNLLLRSTRIEGLGIREGEAAREKTARLSLVRALSPKTAASIGVRRQLFDSTGSRDAQETAVFAALVHRF